MTPPQLVDWRERDREAPSRSAMRGYRGKRLIDLIVVAALSPIWVPIFLITSALVRLRLGQPVFFTQQRAGLGGALFDIVKFRTMTDARDSDGRLFPDSARLTRFGRTLRATSLDELPELLNVLRGEMSLVGPRPLLSGYMPLYSVEHRRRHDVRPGVTGLAQVSGRNALSWAERFDLDVWYADHVSPGLDARIVLKTFTAVFARRDISARGEATMTYFTGYESLESQRSTHEEGRSPDPDPIR